MKTMLRPVGNSQGILIPKPLLAQIGMVQEVDLTVEDGAIVLRPTKPKAREGWADASRQLAKEQDDALVWPEFGNVDDASLAW
jgi:antitoxin MazE